MWWNRDMNLPKFVFDDVPLFLGLIKDLFPGLECPRVSYPDFNAAVETALTDGGYILLSVQVWSSLSLVFETMCFCFWRVNVTHCIENYAWSVVFGSETTYQMHLLYVCVGGQSSTDVRDHDDQTLHNDRRTHRWRQVSGDSDSSSGTDVSWPSHQDIHT